MIDEISKTNLYKTVKIQLRINKCIYIMLVKFINFWKKRFRKYWSLKKVGITFNTHKITMSPTFTEQFWLQMNGLVIKLVIQNFLMVIF